MLNRRNTLLLLGVFVVAGGVVLATGAFSTVEADRTVNVNTEGDGAALLGLQANDTYNGIQGGGTGDTLELELVDINQNARTTFDYAVNVTNRGNQTITLSTNDTSVDGITFLNEDEDPLHASGNEQSIGSNSSVYIGLEVDTTADNASSGDEIGVTFTAET
jgi:hypothetical protein